MANLFMSNLFEVIASASTPLGAASAYAQFDIVPADLATGKVALRDVSTGALLGATMTMGQLFTGVASLIRSGQIQGGAPELDFFTIEV